MRTIDHAKPVTRRDFLSAGLVTGSATVMVPTVASLLAARGAHADVLADLTGIGAAGCTAGAGNPGMTAAGADVLLVAGAACCAETSGPPRVAMRRKKACKVFIERPVP